LSERPSPFLLQRKSERSGTPHTRQDPSSFISITGQASIAERLVRLSPLQYDYIREHGYETSAPASSSSPTSPYHASPSSRYSASPRATPAHETAARLGAEKRFTVHVFPAPDYPYGERVRQSPLYGPWRRRRPDVTVLDKSSFVMDALRQVIPRSMASDGLTDWESAGQRDAGEMADAGVAAAHAAVGATAKHFARERVITAASKGPQWNGLTGEPGRKKGKEETERTRSEIRKAGGRKR